MLVYLTCLIQGLQKLNLKKITACLPDVSSFCQVKRKIDNSELYECCPIKTLDS
jgi:hypothetical protein